MASVIAVGLLIVGMTALKNAELDVSKDAQRMLNHTADGVLDIQSSSAGGHIDLVSNGVLFGFTHPVGIGLGGTTSASRFGDAQAMSSEIDFSDIFISCGAPVGTFYCAVIVILIRVSLLRWRECREPTALLALGVMIAQLGHWGQGALYATSALHLFLIGSVDRLSVMTPLRAARSMAQPVAQRPFRRFRTAAS